MDIVIIDYSDPASYLWQNLLATSNIKNQVFDSTSYSMRE